MKTEEKVFTFFLLFIVVLMVALTFGYRPGARLVPILVGVCALILMVSLCLMVLFQRFASLYQRWEEKRHVYSKDTESEDLNERMREAERTDRKKERSVVTWLLFLVAGTYVFGFFIAIPLFLFLFLKLWAHETWVLSLSMSGVVWGAVFFIFAYILGIPLHQGIVF